MKTRLHIFLALATLLMACGGNGSGSDNANTHPSVWPHGEIHYTFTDVGTIEQERIERIMRQVETDTDYAVLFIENDEPADYVVEIYFGESTESTIGRNVAAYMRLRSLYSLDITHELAHVIGLRHEFQRPDRDEYVFVDLANVLPNRIHDYEKRNDHLFDLSDHSFDHSSITNFRFFTSTDDSIDGYPICTVLPNPDDTEDSAIGWADGPYYASGLSGGDVEKIKAIYNN